MKNGADTAEDCEENWGPDFQQDSQKRRRKDLGCLAAAMNRQIGQASIMAASRFSAFIWLSF